jgi:hypothetical protein
MSSPVGPAGCYSSNPLKLEGIPDFYDINTQIIEVFDVIVADQIWLRCHTRACFYYEKSNILSLYYFLFHYSRSHMDFPSIDEDIKSWPLFLLLYCFHKRNIFVWLDK